MITKQFLRFSSIWAGLTIFPVILFQASAYGQDEFDRPPIEYRHKQPVNCISELQAKLDSGEVKLDQTDKQGYLLSVLEALEVPVESQLLVFSKTSLQMRRISPKTPRALYFNDDVYIGYCHAGDILEIAAIDDKLGTVFYTLNQAAVDVPKFVRETDDCLTCHSSSRTDGVPGLLARSLFVNAIGMPIFSGGSHNVDHTTPLQKRWGGWYVTGKHGEQTHQGNLQIRAQSVPSVVDNAQGQNVTELSDRFKVDNYLTPHSDIVALMVMEHQLLVHNRLVRANYSTRQALDHEITMNKALGEPEGQRRESTTRRIQNAGDKLIEALLLVDEAPLTSPVTGTSGYAEQFSQSGLQDSQGRSLRDLDLQTRLFKYPCSYLIYSSAFETLPVQLKDYLWERLWEILALDVKADKFQHLSQADRKAIIQILRETRQDLPDYWQKDQKPESGT